MVTREQAVNARKHGTVFHVGECKRMVGPRGGVTDRIERWRANGQCVTWVTRPKEFRLPVKFGLKRYGYITESNAHLVHTEQDCPLNQKGELV